MLDIGLCAPHVCCLKLICFCFSESAVCVTMMDIRPNHTIYVNNLNEKIKKEGKNIPGVYIFTPVSALSVDCFYFIRYLSQIENCHVQ